MLGRTVCVCGGGKLCVCVCGSCVCSGAIRSLCGFRCRIGLWLYDLHGSWPCVFCFFFVFSRLKKAKWGKIRDHGGEGVMRITMMEALYRQHHLIDQRSPEAGDKWATSPSPHYAHTLTPQLRRGAVDISNGWAFVLSAAAGVSDTCGGSWYERNEKGEMASQSHFFKKCFKRQKEQWQALITSELLSLPIWLYIFL